MGGGVHGSFSSVQKRSNWFAFTIPHPSNENQQIFEMIKQCECNYVVNICELDDGFDAGTGPDLRWPQKQLTLPFLLLFSQNCPPFEKNPTPTLFPDRLEIYLHVMCVSMRLVSCSPFAPLSSKENNNGFMRSGAFALFGAYQIKIKWNNKKKKNPLILNGEASGWTLLVNQNRGEGSTKEDIKWL